MTYEQFDKELESLSFEYGSQMHFDGSTLRIPDRNTGITILEIYVKVAGCDITLETVKAFLEAKRKRAERVKRAQEIVGFLSIGK